MKRIAAITVFAWMLALTGCGPETMQANPRMTGRLGEERLAEIPADAYERINPAGVHAVEYIAPIAIVEVARAEDKPSLHQYDLVVEACLRGKSPSRVDLGSFVTDAKLRFEFLGSVPGSHSRSIPFENASIEYDVERDLDGMSFSRTYHPVYATPIAMMTAQGHLLPPNEHVDETVLNRYRYSCPITTTTPLPARVLVRPRIDPFSFIVQRPETEIEVAVSAVGSIANGMTEHAWL